MESVYNKYRENFCDNIYDGNEIVFLTDKDGKVFPYYLATDFYITTNGELFNLAAFDTDEFFSVDGLLSTFSRDGFDSSIKKLESDLLKESYSRCDFEHYLSKMNNGLLVDIDYEKNKSNPKIVMQIKGAISMKIDFYKFMEKVRHNSDNFEEGINNVITKFDTISEFLVSCCGLTRINNYPVCGLVANSVNEYVEEFEAHGYDTIFVKKYDVIDGVLVAKDEYPNGNCLNRFYRNN